MDSCIRRLRTKKNHLKLPFILVPSHFPLYSDFILIAAVLLYRDSCQTAAVRRFHSIAERRVIAQMDCLRLYPNMTGEINFRIFFKLISLDIYCDFLFHERHVSYIQFPSESYWHAVESLRNCIHSDVANEDKVSGQWSKAQRAFRDRNNFLFRRCRKLSLRLDWRESESEWS